MEKQGIHTPSFDLYPTYDSRSMCYKELGKLGDIGKPNIPIKKFIEVYSTSIGCEILMEEICGVPLPKQNDYDWGKIINREVRAVLYDETTQELISNSFILQCNWKAATPGQWLFNTNQNHTNARSFVIKVDTLNNKIQGKDIKILFELVLYT
mmetsp:Transcript_30802/g.30314  ORF Transcript_30802/g.30314 Transcript_30802/m.30314 type:complete len:153 (+) Transcript_30802:1087-1545(+)